MPSVSVLYIDDEIVGPHLELLRRICDPESTARPHVTVRYFDKLGVPNEHLETKVSHLDFLEPGLFQSGRGSPHQHRTVFIRCQSDELVPIEHKPHYPTSEFHVTLYDGGSSRFANALVNVLREFNWHFRLPLSGAKLSTIDLQSRTRSVASKELSPQLRGILREALSGEFDSADLSRLTPPKRLAIVRAVCLHLKPLLKEFDLGSLNLRRLSPRDLLETEENLESKIHLTPPELANAITGYVLSLLAPEELPVHFGDPAIGAGAFYLALAKMLPQDRIGSAIGIDLSREQVIAARSRLARYPINIMPGDFLHLDRLPKRNLILANPPYLRHQGIPQAYKQELRERASQKLGFRVSGRSGLYVYFVILSHEWMRSDAISAWLIPSEFMQTTYGAALRHYLAYHVQLIRVHQFGHDAPQFENAAVLPALIVFRNRLPHLSHEVEMTSGGTLQAPATREVVRVEELRRDRTWAIPSRSLGAQDGTGLRISDLFRVTRGIATGANDFFILKRSEATKAGISKRFLKPILPKARTLKCDIVETDEDGFPRIDPQLCLLDCDLPEDEIRLKFPSLYGYIEAVKSSGVLQNYLIRHRNPWYKQEKRNPAPFLCTYMGRGSNGAPPLKFIWNKSQAIATNTYLMLYPLPSLTEVLSKYPRRAKDVFSLLKETANETVTAHSRIHAGGLRKIEPRELGNVRLGSEPSWLRAAVESQLDFSSPHL